MREVDAGLIGSLDEERMITSLTRKGVFFHRGISGKTYRVGDEVDSWKGHFAAGVTRVDASGKVVATPTTSVGGYPQIETGNGVRAVGHAAHTHTNSDLRSDGVPVITIGFTAEEESDLEDDLLGLP